MIKMDEMKMEFHGDEIERAVDEEVQKGLLLVGNGVRNSASLNAPVRTGNLRNSLHAKNHAQAIFEEEKHSVTVGTNVEYAPNVEYGWGQRAQPYLEPAFREWERKGQKLMIDYLTGALRRGGG